MHLLRHPPTLCAPSPPPQALGSEALGCRSNFFTAGGNSLRGMKLVGLIRKQLWAGMDIGLLFEHNSVLELALHMQQQGVETAGSKPVGGGRWW
jgi:hypothetical protein